jgi:hypothetical protein
MGRVTEKALRSRQYVFEGVSRERRAVFARHIRAVRVAEERATVEARRAADERAREAARTHAAGILRRTQGAPGAAGGEKLPPKSDHVVSKELAVLNAELTVLTAERSRLYEMLSRRPRS